MAENPDESWISRLHRALAILSVGCLILVLGIVVGAGNKQLLIVSKTGLLSYFKQDEDFKWWWDPVRYKETGVVRNAARHPKDDVTFYVSSALQRAYLIDMGGKVVHQWHFPSSTTDVGPVDGAELNSDPDTVWDAAYLYPNGDILVVFRRFGISQGMARIDRNSKPVWYSDLPFHHAPTVGPDGRIYAMTNDVRTTPVPGIGYLDPPFLEDFVVILDPSGKVLRRISVVDAFRNSKYVEYLHLARNLIDGDAFHANKAEVLSGSSAKELPFMKEGNIVISLREIHTIAVLDPNAETIVWATKGPWFSQHDPEVLPNGNILLFDNRGDTSGWGISRALEIDARNQAIVWSYGGSPQRPLDSYVRSGVQRLANGNTMIVESNGGRILEVTPGGEIVWEFVTPDRQTKDGRELTAIIGLGTARFARKDLPFLNKVIAASN